MHFNRKSAVEHEDLFGRIQTTAHTSRRWPMWRGRRVVSRWSTAAQSEKQTSFVFFFFFGGMELGDRREGTTNPHPEQRTKSEQKVEFSDHPKQNGQLMTKRMASTTFGGGGGKMRLQLDVAKKSVQFKYKNCNNAPTHSQFFFSTEGIPQHAVYPALPSREQGGITATVGGENSEKSPCESRRFFLFLWRCSLFVIFKGEF